MRKQIINDAKSLITNNIYYLNKLKNNKENIENNDLLDNDILNEVFMNIIKTKGISIENINKICNLYKVKIFKIKKENFFILKIFSKQCLSNKDIKKIKKELYIKI